MTGHMWIQDHVAFRVPDMDAAVAFYVNILGMRLMSRTVDEAHHEEFAFLELDGGNLELLVALDEQNRPAAYAPPLPQPPYCPHLALKTDNLAGVVRLLGERGVTVLAGPLEIPGSVCWMYAADPGNNVLEFVQWL